MNAITAVVSFVLMVMVAAGVYHLQWWLENWYYRRHFED
jgi:hypothetical protein